MREAAEATRPIYLPTLEEIEERKAMLRWLQHHMAFDRQFIAHVMLHDQPSYELVRRLAKEQGIREMHRKLQPITRHFPEK